MAGTSAEPRLSNVAPTPLDLVLFVPYASAQLQAPYSVRIVTYLQEEYVSKVVEEKVKKNARSKSTTAHQIITSRTRADSILGVVPDEASSQQHPRTYEHSDEIVIAAVHDQTLKVVELSFKRCSIPRMLIQIIAFCMPYQQLLTKLSIRRAQLKGDALYEIAKLLPASQLTDICLDDSPVTAKNYYLLLDHAQLQCLSLARCKLDDEDCANLAAKLVYPLPASRTLHVLSLVSNAITDIGACALAGTLRSNRVLQHINLSGNHITDVGARTLFRSISEFPLTYEELITKRQRFIDFLRLRKEVYLRCVAELVTAPMDRTDDSSRSCKKRGAAAATARSRKHSGVSVSVGISLHDSVGLRAETMTNELMGSYSDPFRMEETISRDGYIYSLGNTSLCYLNLAYNDLCYASLVALSDVLQYQSTMIRKTGPGLLRVVLEGNLLPETCHEFNVIHELLEQSLSFKVSKPTKRLERTKSKAGTPHRPTI